jgi:hypothetical protein
MPSIPFFLKPPAYHWLIKVGQPIHPLLLQKPVRLITYSDSSVNFARFTIWRLLGAM